MSRIDELIEDLCPHGVSFNPLGNATEIKTGTPISKSDIQRNPGPYPVINSGREPLGYVSSYNTEGSPLGITSRGAGVGSVTWCKGPYHRGPLNYGVAVVDHSRLDVRFLYHLLNSFQASIHELCTFQGIPALNRSNLQKLRIPVPPLEVQREIVRILDQFTQLEAELEAELEKRRQQYEYYRDDLLTCPEGGTWTTLGEVCTKVSSGGTPTSGKSQYYGGRIPWVRTQEVDFGTIHETGMTITEEGLANSSAKWIPEHSVIVAMYGATAAKVAINEIPVTTNQACCNLQIDPEMANYRYVFYWIANRYLELKSLGEGSQSNINSKKVKSFPIQLPPRDEQDRIVELLDKFDALVNDLSVGLPAELDARRKQYEYYRDWLLTFKELPA